MERQFVNRNKIPYFSKLTNDFAYNQEGLTEFINAPFSKDAIKKQIIEKQTYFTKDKRVLLHRVLSQQNAVLNDAVLQKEIDTILSPNTFVVTTGHQLNLFTGPLYTIYKIAHTIQLANSLSEQFPNYRVLPLFWMASEDHDKKEINHFHLFGKKITWNTTQTGPVGQFELENWGNWQEEMLQLFREEEQEKIKPLLHAYTGKNLAEANRKLIHFLFNKHKMLILDGNDANLKRSFSPVFKQEIEEQFIAKAVSATNELLSQKDIAPQVFVRPINLFYCEKGLRSRFVPDSANNHIHIEGKGNFSKEQLLLLLEQAPENFSPNALLRPIYQEWVLPNITYIGGGGELAYWLQLKSSFEAVKLPYPLLSLRHSYQLITASVKQKLTKVGLSFEDFAIHNSDELKQLFVRINGNDFNFSTIELKIKEIENDLLQKTGADSSLKVIVEKEIKSIQKKVADLETRIQRAEKSKHEVNLQQIARLKEQLFPNNKLQERIEHFLPFYLSSTGIDFISTIISISTIDNSDFQLVSL